MCGLNEIINEKHLVHFLGPSDNVGNNVKFRVLPRTYSSFKVQIKYDEIIPWADKVWVLDLHPSLPLKLER